MKRTVFVALLAAGACVAANTLAQTYPDQTRSVSSCRTHPGGGTDTIARLISEKLCPALGQQIVVDNRGGAGGRIAAELVARAPKDGYTLLLGSARDAHHRSRARRRPQVRSAEGFRAHLARRARRRTCWSRIRRCRRRTCAISSRSRKRSPVAHHVRDDGPGQSRASRHGAPPVAGAGEARARPVQGRRARHALAAAGRDVRDGRELPHRAAAGAEPTACARSA